MRGIVSLAAAMALPPQAAESRDLEHSEHGERRRVEAAREAVLAMRANQEIGDDAFHQIEEELDWLEMAGPRRS